VRIAFVMCLLMTLLACASAPTVTPREYLDEQTAATIKVVADPWIFTRVAGADQRDFLNVYAIDVNRMGEHRQYLAVLQWWPSVESEGDTSAQLDLQVGERELILQSATAEPRSLGIAQPIDATVPRTSKWWYFPVDKEILGAIAGARDLRATFVSAEQRVDYAIWRDGRAELSELTNALP
jgi:hypothetical protein